jgi:hypothetical protein
MTIKALYPDTQPSLSLDFANTKALDPRITFARASTARFYDGKTVAKAEENLFLRSEEFDNAVWSKTATTVTANAAAAPDGTTTAEFLLPTASNQIVQTLTLQSGVAYTMSVYAKKGGYDFVRVGMSSSWFGTFTSAYFNLDTGTVGTTSNSPATSIVDVGNGWYRCSITKTTTATTSAGVSFLVGSADAVIATGDGTSGIFLWGAQLEQRSAVTAYTPTTTQPITNYVPVLQSAANNVARFDHNPVTGESLGLLIEEQRTNLFTYSEDWSNAAWTKTDTTIQANTVIAPDGTLTADKTIPSSGSNTTFQAISVTSGVSYTLSIYSKRAGNRYLVIRNTFAGLSGDNVSFDLLDGVVQRNVSGVTSTITPVGNGWYRCSCSWASGATGASNYQVKTASEAVSTSSATLTGFYNSFDGIYIWGAQLEVGAFPTSYIPTVASQVTRSADAASMTGANFSSWYRADEGNVYFEGQSASVTAVANKAAFTISDGSTSNRIEQFFAGTSSLGVPQALILISAGAVVQTNQGFGSSLTNNNAAKLMTAYKFNDIAATVNGGTLSADSTAIIPVVDRMFIGANSTGSTAYLNGTIKKLAYYPKRLANAELQALTQI